MPWRTLQKQEPHTDLLQRRRCLSPGILPRSLSLSLPLVPVLLAAQTGSVFAPGVRLGSAHPSTWAGALQYSSLRNPRAFSNSYSKPLLPLHPATKGIVLCVHLFVCSSRIWPGCGYFPKPPFPQQRAPDSRDTQICP